MKSMAEGNSRLFFSALAEDTKKDAPLSSKNFLHEMETNRPDLLITASLAEWHEVYANVALRIPTLRVQLIAISREKRASLGFPTLPFGLHNFIFFNVILPMIYFESWKDYDDAVASLGGMKVFPRLNYKQYAKEADAPRIPIIICKSELYKPILNPSIHSNYRFVGAVIVDKYHEMKHSESFGGSHGKEADIFSILEEFISRDDSRKPVYMGWGSMMCKSPGHMVVMATEALRESNQRGIILGGWAQLSFDVLLKSTNDNALIEYAKENVLFVAKAPHEWLLPQVSTAVHHGGAGTTNASLRAGVPTIITPVFLDQFDNSYLVNQLGCGVGFSKQFQSITTKELAGAILRVTSDSTYSKVAGDIAAKLHEENGAQSVVKEIELHWNENVVAGRWKEVVDSQLKTDEHKIKRSTKLLLASIGLVAAFLYCTKRN